MAHEKKLASLADKARIAAQLQREQQQHELEERHVAEARRLTLADYARLRSDGNGVGLKLGLSVGDGVG